MLFYHFIIHHSYYELSTVVHLICLYICRWRESNIIHERCIENRKKVLLECIIIMLMIIENIVYILQTQYYYLIVHNLKKINKSKNMTIFYSSQ